MTATAYYLRPKDTKLPTGHDPSLDAPGAVDAERRSVPPSTWPPVNLAKGSSKPGDPLPAPPPTDPAKRSLAPFVWPTLGPTVANRALRETLSPQPDLDPDVAFWPVTPVQRWPFAGHPVDGIWPLGWCGIDNTGTFYICTAGGAPGTWQAVAGPGTDTGWITAASLLVNGWAAGNPAPRYRRINGIVYLQGQLSSTSATSPVAFTLPAGFRPGITVTGALQFTIAAFDNSNAYQASEMFINGDPAGPTGRVTIGTYASSGATAPTGAASIVCSFPADQ